MAVPVSKTMTINEVIKQSPRTIGVFNSFNMDSCCGGARSLERAAREERVDLAALLAALERALGQG